VIGAVAGRAAYAAEMAPSRRPPVVHPTDQPPPEAPYRPGWVPRRDLSWNGSGQVGQPDRPGPAAEGSGSAAEGPGRAGDGPDRPGDEAAGGPDRPGGRSERSVSPSSSSTFNPGGPTNHTGPAIPLGPVRPPWALPAALVAMAVVYPAAFWFQVVPFWSAMVAFSAFSWWAAWHPYFRVRLRPTRRLVLMGLLSGVALYLLFLAGALVVRETPLWPWVERVLTLTRTTAPGGLAVLVIVFATSPSEEVLWRGAVFARLTRRYGAGWKPVVLATVAYAGFVALSGSVVLPLAALVCGTVWTRQRQVTGSIVPGLVSHTLWSLLMYLWVPGLSP
jgi:membrane protease YdiL (CAAX protease family)